MDSNIVKIAIISDLHVMAPQLLVNDGSAFEQYLRRDRKMLRESTEILSTLVSDIIEQKPHIVLVTGDLTKDGERASHQVVASQLHRLTQAGIEVLVVPGNHDINNPDAKIYDRDSAIPTDTITRSEFAHLYHDMGYDSRSRRDPDTLSYCRDVTDKLTILAIDACMDRLNTFVSRGDAQDHCKTSGMLTAASQQWLVDQAAAATAAGRRVIAMMHHHLVPHFHMEDTLASPYMVDDASQLCQRLVKADVHVIFTGHLHITDVSQTTLREGSMIEVATAAAVGYPCQWRMVNCHPAAGKLQLRTITRGILTRYWPNITQAIDNYSIKHPLIMRHVNLPDTPDGIANLLLNNLQEPVTRAYIAFAQGNETGNNQLVEQLIRGAEQVVNETISGILRPVAKAALRLRIYGIARQVLRSILEDRNDIGTKHETVINDHTAIISF